jgi:hypothetical protein
MLFLIMTFRPHAAQSHSGPSTPAETVLLHTDMLQPQGSKPDQDVRGLNNILTSFLTYSHSQDV